MKKIFLWVKNNFLFLLTLFLIAFIPLYPKIPLLDIKNTWVYVRVEDFVVLFSLLFWLSLLFRKKVTLRTPLTIPIFVFWLIGGIATLHGVILIFPTLANVFPNVSFLAYLRHIEYLALFFVAYSSINNKKMLNVLIAVIAGTLLVVTLYGFGQRYAGFPAYLTMNEQFAKGDPIRLSALSRVPSTFAGHYDLAAYLVLVIPIILSLVFGFKNWIVKITLFVIASLGVILLFMTVSRVSFFALGISIFFVVLFQKRKAILLFIPVLLAFAFLVVFFKPTLLQRFSSTVKEIEVLVDANTGDAIGGVNFVDSSSYLKDKVLTQTLVKDRDQINQALSGDTQGIEFPEATESAKKEAKYPAKIPLVKATNISTGENLPQGTGYINLSLSPVVKRLGNFFYEVSPDKRSTTSAQIVVLHGDFLVKRASAYDLSFTTRFQGEWPHALEIFEKNIFLGSGYGAVGLSIDNNYFRMLAEIGLLGVASFIGIFVVVGIYIKKSLSNLDSEIAKKFIIGFVAGLIGLASNAVLIDVFEASKVAYTLWLFVGIVIGVLTLYRRASFNIYKELIKAASSIYAMIVYLGLVALALFSSSISNYFAGDDFTWLRWVADCGRSCPSLANRILEFFTNSQGFFYRPGAKIYYLFMYSFFWLNQVAYHVVSIALHFIIVVLFFLFAKKILKNNILAATSAFAFLFMSGHLEVIFWISSTGYLFNAVFSMSALLLFAKWIESKKNIYFWLSFVSILLGLLFHEIGIVVPLLVILYRLYLENYNIKKVFRDAYSWIILFPIPIYLLARFMSNSHWSGGDYSYNLVKLPFNFIGNIFGYFLLITTGPISLSIYEQVRNFARNNFVLISLISIFAVILIGAFYKLFNKKIEKEDKRILIFGFLFFAISLLPFLGLGNITSRYSYLASFGLIIVFVHLAKRMYYAVISYGKDVVILGSFIVFFVFSLFHIIQIQQTAQNWASSGNMVKTFFESVDRAYTNSWSNRALSLHFVNVPIKNGEAWVFPVGLKDALWFVSKNPNFKIYIHSDINEALTQAGESIDDIVFEFNGDGSITEVTRYNKHGIPLNVLREQN